MNPARVDVKFICLCDPNSPLFPDPNSFRKLQIPHAGGQDSQCSSPLTPPKQVLRRARGNEGWVAISPERVGKEALII